MLSYPTYRGMVAMLIAVICYSLNDALIKWLSDTYHPLHIIFCRSLFVFLVLLGMIFRKLNRTESDALITIWFMGACFIISGFLMPFYWQTPSFEKGILFIALGIVGGTAAMATTRAFSLAPAYIVGPSIAWFGTFFGYIVWGDIPDTFVVVFLLIFRGVYLVYQEACGKTFAFALSE